MMSMHLQNSGKFNHLLLQVDIKLAYITTGISQLLTTGISSQKFIGLWGVTQFYAFYKFPRVMV